jgi:hypothetical protein
MNGERAGKPVTVARWGELRGERKLPGTVLRVLVGGQHAGGIERKRKTWLAVHQSRPLGRYRATEHATVEEALRAVLRSGFARLLGARTASPVHWSDNAQRAARRGGAQ